VFDHVGVWVSDRGRSRAFYETVLATLGRELVHEGGAYDEWSDFSIGQDDDRPVTRGLHVGFGARSRDEVDAFWRAGIEAGCTSDGDPGLRAHYHPEYYGGFLLDPDGNSVEAVHHGVPRTGDGVIDHLWVRVADLGESRRFYAAVAPVLGLTISDREGRFHLQGGDRTCAFVAGAVPTENLHIAFPVVGDDAVAAFHRAALEAGFRDNGPPGERDYHPGYYAAFALDRDGTNVEAVDHRGYGEG
jgi:catechol 2,3-dioxygenase-like lactoylglutathione lyase family enzyme